MKSEILSYIKSLPPLPKSINDVQRITTDPNSSIKDLIKVIKSDPLITANLLKVANSPLYGFTRQIKSVDQVVSLFGMSVIKGFVISFVIKNLLKLDLSAYGISESRFSEVSFLRSAIAFNWYKSQKNKLDIIFTDSFLIDVGIVIISLYLKGKNLVEEFKKNLTSENREELEKAFVGFTSYEITAEVFKHWHFADELIYPIENILNPKDEYSYVMDVLRTLVDLLDDNKINLEKGISKAVKYNLDVSKLKIILEKVLS